MMHHHPILEGKRALVVGVANEHSIAWGCARSFHALGAELVLTYLNDKARPHVERQQSPKADLQGGLLDCSLDGFLQAMDVSCHSFVRMAKLAAPLMTQGGSMFAMSYHGADKVVPNYNVMGPVKAALESSCRYLAHELGPRDIRVHAISPGPLKTRAASGLKDFDLLLSDAVARSPLGELVDIDDVGQVCAYLASDFARRLTGSTVYVDGGLNIIA